MPKDWLSQTFKVNQLYRIGDADPEQGTHDIGRIRVLVYGEEGSGKTHFCGTAPNPFFIDTDRGLSTIRKQHPEAEILPIERGRGAFTLLLSVFRDAVNKTGPFAEDGPYADIETIVLDGYTALAETLMFEIANEAGRSLTNNKPTWDDYNALKQRLIAITNMTRDLTHHHFIATAWEDVTKDDLTGETLGGPMVLGGFSKQIGHYFDEMYYMSVRKKGGEYLYEAHSKKHGRYAAKSRIGVPPVLPDPTFDKLEAAYGKALS